MLCVNIEKMYELQGDMTDTDFAKKLGISRSQLWRVRNKKSSVGAEFIVKFKNCYPEENTDDYFFTSNVPLKEQNRMNATV